MSRPGSKLLLAAVVATLPLAGCGMFQNSTPTAAVAAPVPAQPALSASDSAFFDQASRSGIEEVTFSQLARQHAVRAATRSFAVKMVDSHTTMNQQLTQLAASKNVTPPTTMDDAHQTSYEALSKLRGRAFDRSYLNGQATDHAATLQLFQNEAQNGTDPDVKAFATRVAPDIKMHLDMARRLGGRVLTDASGQTPSTPSAGE